MNIMLEMKQFCKDFHGNLDKEDMFYKYNIDGNLIWFSQNQNNGNIYTVYVRLKECIDEYFDVWVHCEDNKLFYPYNVIIEVNHLRIKPSEVEEVVHGMNYVNKLCHMIMSIFKLEEHYSLWSKHNEKNVGNYCELCGEYIGRGTLKVCDKCASEYKFWEYKGEF